MKKLGNFIKIAFILAVGATFHEQINSAIDYVAEIDYVALGANIELIAGKIADAAVYIYDFVVGLFDTPPAVEPLTDGSGTVSSTIN